jgi:hypothetical protein
MPLISISASAYLRHFSKTIKEGLIIIALQLLLVVSIGLAWEPVEAVIVRAEKPVLNLNDIRQFPLNIEYQDNINLMGWAVEKEVLSPGDTLRLTLFWKSEGPSTKPYTVFIHLVGSDGKIVAQQDNWSLDGNWPPTCWKKGEDISDPFELLLPKEVSPGDFELVIGLYDAVTGKRLIASHGEDAVFLTNIRVIPPQSN